MKTSIQLPMDGIRSICEECGVTELAVFGSVLRDDFGPESDVDFIVTFKNNDAGPWGIKLTDIQERLGALLNRQVDVITRPGIERSRNWIIQGEILSSAEVVYAE